ncbi:MAG: methionyl-tRNA formyltransferase [Acidobacteriota bacterium]|nr:methionyl-tRNA formyltransferase [Acidobacteriota bacterium]
MNLLFCGTPDFAVPSLESLIAEQFAVDLVVTNQDEPSGRGYQLKASPVKQSALRAGMEVYQPAKLQDPATVELLSRYRPDAIVVVAYGHILPKWMIDLPRLGCLNVHASLLPKYRGAAPIQWSLIRGEAVTGVTTMRIDVGLDTGDTFLKREVAIQDEDTAETLGQRLSAVGAALLIETLRRLEQGDLQAQPQDHAQATLAPILKKEDGRVNWKLPALEIWNRIRGLRPWPGAYTTFRGKNLHIWSAPRPVEGETTHLEPGTLISDRASLRVACGQGTVLEAKELQLEGRKRLAPRDFLNGVKISPGEKVE